MQLNMDLKAQREHFSCKKSAYAIEMHKKAPLHVIILKPPLSQWLQGI